MIEGGYILLAKKILDSEIMDKPPHYLKLWIWMLGKAFFMDGDKLQRGQLLTTISEMQKACGYRVGARYEQPTKDQIRNCYEHLTNTHMITTAKTTRGLLITICNYDYYQNTKNYEHHDENSTKPTRTPKQSHTIEKEVKKKENIYSDLFVTLWGIYPNKDGKKEAERHFHSTVKTDEDADKIQSALKNYLSHLKKETWKKPKNGSTWFNNWRDWIPVKPSAITKGGEYDKAWDEELAAREEDLRQKTGGVC